MSKGYKIHEFAELAGMTARTLRHYDRVGLLKPRRTEAGYRVYSEADLERLEQVVALKYLGLPLAQIKLLLDRKSMALPEALRMQRRVLEEKRREIGRAIAAIEAAERAPEDALMLRQLIEVLGMQNEEDPMKRYFSNEAWARQECRAEAEKEQARQEWSALWKEVESSLEEDPLGERGQALAARWRELWQRTTQGDAEVQAGHEKAWMDRANWPEAARQRTAGHDREAIAAFIVKALGGWTRRYYSAESWAKLQALQREGAGLQQKNQEEWRAIFTDAQAALGEDPAGERGQALAVRWRELWHRTTGGDPAVAEAMLKAWADRQNWSSPAPQYPGVDLERVVAFLKLAVEAGPRR